jgi:hypothetical protein
MMNPTETQALRRTIGASVLAAQKAARSDGALVEDVLVEVLASLLSLAAHLSYHNMSFSRHLFLAACEEASKDQWGDRDGRG